MMDRRILFMTLVALVCATQAGAQGFPGHPVRLIIPFPPGGSADPIGRVLALGMERRLGQTMVIENRSGAGGVVGTDAVAKAVPDGYTVGLFGVGSMTVVQNLMPSVPYDPLKDLVPVSLVVGVPQLLVASKALGVTTLEGVLARARPGTLTYGSSGNGNSPHLAMATPALRGGLEMVHVPYRGVAPAVTDLMAGRVDLMFADLPAMIGPVRNGAIVPVAVGSAEPSAVLPGVPTVAQAGLRGVDVENWYGVVAPAGTPPDRVARLEAAITGAMQEADTRRRMAELGVRLIGSDAPTFAAHLRSEVAKWAGVIREARITVG